MYAVAIGEMFDAINFHGPFDDILEYIEEWVADDFGSLSGLVFQDENGEEL